MTDQQKNYQQWAECYTDELTYDEVQKAQAFDVDKFKLKDGKLESIEQTLEERGQQYGSFEAQAECVGSIIGALQFCARENGRGLSCVQLGCITYIAIKLARFAVNPNHLDSMHDLEAYAHLINELYNGEKK